MTCEETRLGLGLAEDGEALPPEATRHLDGCAACRTEADGRRRLLDLLRTAGAPPLPSGVRQRALRILASRPRAARRWGWAAAAAAVLLVFTPLLIQKPNPTPVSEKPPQALPAFDAAAHAAVGRRLDYLEWDLAPTSAYGGDFGLNDLRQQINALERAVADPAPPARDPGHGAAPGGRRKDALS